MAVASLSPPLKKGGGTIRPPPMPLDVEKNLEHMPPLPHIGSPAKGQPPLANSDRDTPDQRAEGKEAASPSMCLGAQGQSP
ncbi:hypothetical protein Scep_030159 [Stephania cephalantha]|uniref:Uncharacterized protein n=1 Tax=Stephania cephalantha TaxID=152367 RepID=A0AAP0E2C9_9MAGN